MWPSSFLGIIVEKTILSPLNSFGIFVKKKKNQLIIYAWVYSWILNSIPQIYVFIPV